MGATLRYVAHCKKPRTRLKTFMKEVGGVNACDFAISAGNYIDLFEQSQQWCRPVALDARAAQHRDSMWRK